MICGRHARALLVLVVVLGVLAGCGTGPSGLSAPGGASPSAQVEQRPAAVPGDAVAVVVDRVVDGDTVRLRALGDDGLASPDSVRVRLLNIDAPELPRDGQPGECLAEQATSRLVELVSDSEVVWIAADREDRDRFDRPLRGLWTEDGVFVTEVLAQEGLAVAVLFQPNDRFHDRIAAAEEQARAAQLGVHGPACR